MKIKNLLLKYTPEIIVLFLGSFFGIFLMFSTFAKENGMLYISAKAWSDFASHIPLIRSFSMGYNFPPEYPLFPGEAIKYHFGFYFGVGMLEKIGIPIDLSLNIPSVLGFIFLSFTIYYLAYLIFKSKAVGVLSLLFFIFNSSLSYIYYFQKNSISIESIRNIPLINNFQSFAPYGEGVISAFWNLNIYTNQRHLALSFSLSLLIVYLLLKPVFKNEKINYKLSVILGVVLGLSFFLHLAVLIMTGLTILFLAGSFKKIRKSAFIIFLISGLISLPQYLYISSADGYNLALNPGYLLAGNFTLSNFFEFWIFNLGLSIILIPLGFVFANKNQRKILLSVVPIFIIGSLFQFSPEIAANHKFFNYFILISNMFSAFAIYIIWKKKNFLKPLAVIFTFLMIFGGIIDFFPLYNDSKIVIADYERREESKWIIKNTYPNAVFLNTTYLYNPASLAGRKIYFGWPYFAWSQGYNTENRGKIFTQILESNDKTVACELLKNNEIDFVEINLENKDDPDLPNISNLYFKEFFSVYKIKNNYNIYDVNKSCN
jgi:hypothetical protein